MTNKGSSVGTCSRCGKKVTRTPRSAAAIVCLECRRAPASTKTCARCRSEQPIEAFSLVRARGRERRHSWCQGCRNAYGSAFYYANHEKRRAAENARYWADPEAARAKDRAYRTPERNHAQKLRRYGLTVAEYDALAEAQDRRCAICQRQEPFELKRPRLVVDHCHKTGNVRGLLCLLCNTALGALREDPELFAAAVRYLSA